MSGCERGHQQRDAASQRRLTFLSLPHLFLSLRVPLPPSPPPLPLPHPSWHPSQAAKSLSYPPEMSQSTSQLAPTPFSTRPLPSPPLSTSNALLYAHVSFEFMVLPNFSRSPPLQAPSAVLQKS